MTETKKRARRRVGDILKIDLGGNLHAYAQVATDPIIVFFDGVHEADVPFENVSTWPVAFRLAVMTYAVKSGVWPVVGFQPLSSANAVEPTFFKQDAISGRLYLHHSTFAETNWERPAQLSECQGLERAAVWDPGHVVDRLRDRHAGRPNSWAESMKIDLARLPPP